MSNIKYTFYLYLSHLSSNTIHLAETICGTNKYYNISNNFNLTNLKKKNQLKNNISLLKNFIFILVQDNYTNQVLIKIIISCFFRIGLFVRLLDSFQYVISSHGTSDFFLCYLIKIYYRQVPIYINVLKSADVPYFMQLF